MSNKMWGGRFAAGPDAILEEINASIDFDRHLFAQDIAGSKAHASMLAAQGIITAADADKIAQGLDTILAEIESGKFKFSRALEDIHMNVESRLAELIGPAAGRLHTARSRNDQVATDFKLYTIRRQRDAGVHASADRAACHLRSSSARLRRDACARPGQARGCAEAHERKSAGFRSACGHLFSDRPRHDREGARFRSADCEQPGRRLRPRLRAGDACCGLDARCICRASPRKS
jgi:hypothetical protein